MAKNAISDWSTTASANTDVGGINIAENCPAANVNNALREIMKQVADLDPLGVAATDTLSGTFTLTGTLDASTGTITLQDDAVTTSIIADDAVTLAKIADANLSGIDTTLVTGTAGTAGHLTRWDSNGDLVSFGQATQTEGAWTTGTSTTETLVSPVKIKAAIEQFAAVTALGTAQATTSGTSFDFTGIPSTATNIVLSFTGVDLSGTDSLLVQIGDSGGIEATGYESASTLTTAAVSDTTGFIMYAVDAGVTFSGTMHLIKHDGNTWIASHNIFRSGGNSAAGSGDKTLSGTLDRVRLTTDGSNTFSAGSVNVLYW